MLKSKMPNQSERMTFKIPPPKFKIGEAIWRKHFKHEPRKNHVLMLKIHSILFDIQKFEWVYFGVRSKYPIYESDAKPYPIFYKQ